MKKSLLTILALAIAATMLQARPVSQETARVLAKSFVEANFEFTRQSDQLTLVRTAFSDRGEACYYVYNVGDMGFVILAADDCVRPVIGYSNEGIFNPDDMAPALAYYLEKVRQGIMAEAENSMARPDVQADWAMLEQCGRLVSRRGGREDEYLCETKWNQNYPYNYCCPADEGGPGGHAYAGCVATAASQVMKYWNHPIQGQGSHTYTPSDNPQYGPQTANYGETTYDWDNMPISISSNSPMTQILAIATLQYHVGVSVDMNYRASGSGAVTGHLCQSMPQYFDYTDAMDNLYRENYTHEEYMRLVMDAIDMRWPMVHRGGGHAYVLDGYNDNDMVHFNWGWSGSSDGWFNIDDHGYTDGESVIYNCVPRAVYAATANMPTNVEVVPADDDALAATISWTNPTVTLTNQPLESIDAICIERNGQLIYTLDNVNPGEDMVFIDEGIPFFDGYRYTVYAIVGEQRGKSAKSDCVVIGPSCGWKIIMQTSAFQGWYGGYVSLYSMSGIELNRFTLTNSTPASVDFTVPVGRVSFGWAKPQNNINNISFVIKDSESNAVYTYSGNTSGMTEGIFFSTNNNCGSGQTESAPYGLVAEMVDGQAVLTWNCDHAPLYGFNIYRDETMYDHVAEGTTYVDTQFDGGHCYVVRALGEGGESDASNETCASAGDCQAASDFDFQYTGSNYKIKLSWAKPEPSDGLSGYYLFRKYGEDGTYERIKLLGSSATSYTDNTANVEGDYFYRLYAYYSQTDCTSSPASVKDNPNLFYLRVYYSPTDVNETETVSLKLFPNPTDQSLCVEAEGMTQVVVYNLLGQVVHQEECTGDTMVINTSRWQTGLYLLTVQSAQGRVSRQISVVH